MVDDVTVWPVRLPGADVAPLGGRVAEVGHVALQLRSEPDRSGTPPPTVDLTAPPGLVAAHDPRRDFEPERLETGLRLHSVDPGSALGVLAEGFVYDVYRTSEFCAESPRRHVEESEPWRAGSTLHVVTDDQAADRIVGVVRTIVGPFPTLPTAAHVDGAPGRDGRVCEIGSLAVHSSQRGLGVANELHRAAFVAGFRAGVSGFCFLVEQWMVDFFTEVYGLPVHPLGPPRHYMGGDVVPVAMWLPEMLDVIALERPAVHAWAVEDLEETLQQRLRLPTRTA